jgi:signal transduction histidine kinase/DNA-binding response OmpR family regulator
LSIFWGSTALLPLSGQTAHPDALWSRIETRLEQPDVDTSYQFVLEEIRAHCGKDANCLLLTYDTIRIELERKFKLAATIKVTNELIHIAKQQSLLEKVAQGHCDLYRYYCALAETRYAVIHIDKSLNYFEQLGDKRKVIKCKFWKAMLIAPSGATSDHRHRVLENLTYEAVAENDSTLAGQIIVHVLQSDIDINQSSPEKIESYFALFERMMKPYTKVRLDRMHWGDFWRIKGIYERQYGDAQTARVYFERSLAIFDEIGDSWRALHTTIYLIEADWLLGHKKEAKTRLEHSLKPLELLHSNALFVKFFKIATMFAEEEGRYKDALGYLKKIHEAQAAIEETTNDKIVDNYYLKVENQNNALALNLRENQLRYSAVIVALVLLLALGLLFGFYRQSRSRRELATQNAIIQQQSEQLKSLDAAKSRFFANVSHELRTPLTLLTSPIRSLLRDKHLSEKQIQLLQMAERSGQQLGQLINEILDLRKLEMGKMALMAEPVELHPWLQTYFAQFESLAEQKQIDYRVILDVPKQAVANLDREKCRQILFNLLSNAFKFTPQGGSVKAAAQFSEQQLQLHIANSGPGIHPDDLPHVFDRYFQSNRPDKPAEGGTGIGLALCREYAQLFGGTIGVESVPGVETVFRVSFPLHLSGVAAEAVVPLSASSGVNGAQKAADVTPFADVPPSTSADQRSTLLVVEDNPDLRDYLRLVLQDKYKVVTAEHGQAAWGMMSKNSADQTAPDHHAPLIVPDLIVSDLMMPVLDGYQLLERLKSADATRHIPVVMLTARAEAQDKLKALRIGVDDYLTKPFDEEELLVRIENLLRNQTARRQAIAEDSPAPEAPTPPLMSQPDREWLETFEAYVQKHYSSDLLSVSSLAYEFAMSESTLLRQLKRLTGLSPQQYIHAVRLEEARRLLENRVFNSIGQVAAKVGYDDARSFARSFKQRFGKLPSEV